MLNAIKNGQELPKTGKGAAVRIFKIKELEKNAQTTGQSVYYK